VANLEKFEVRNRALAEDKRRDIRLMLINPPQKYFGKSLGFNSYFPVGLLSLAANVRDICDVKIFDCLIEKFSIFEDGDFTIYGSSDEDIKGTISEFDPHIVGICIPFSSQSNNGKRVAELCKEVDSSITIIIGGPHPSVQYKSLLEENYCDYAAVGEGEISLRDFMCEVSERLSTSNRVFSAGQEKEIIKNSKFTVDGFAYLHNKGLSYRPVPVLDDLDQLPFPAYDLINLDSYLESPYLYKSRSGIGQKSISMITSRGCPYECVFCSISQHMGRKYRYHSPKYTLDHIEHIINTMGIKNFHFEDDNLTLHRRHFRRILNGILERNIHIAWDTPNGIRADSLSRDTMKLMKKAGAKVLQIAIESGNETVLNDIIKKDSKIAPYYDVAKWCHELDITLGAFYVIGFPGETKQDMEDTTNLALELFTLYNVFPILLFATPLYGTELYLTAKDLGLIADDINDDEFATATQFYGEPLIHTEDFSKDDLKEIARNFEKDISIVANKPNALREVLSNKTALLQKDGALRAVSI
jgi:anaerobic magnesium-protoporphyrin IX monomethyl ester cyclase